MCYIENEWWKAEKSNEWKWERDRKNKTKKWQLCNQRHISCIDTMPKHFINFVSFSSFLILLLSSNKQRKHGEICIENELWKFNI